MHSDDAAAIASAASELAISLERAYRCALLDHSAGRAGHEHATVGQVRQWNNWVRVKWHPALRARPELKEILSPSELSVSNSLGDLDAYAPLTEEQLGSQFADAIFRLQSAPLDAKIKALASDLDAIRSRPRPVSWAFVVVLSVGLLAIGGVAWRSTLGGSKDVDDLNATTRELSAEIGRVRDVVTSIREDLDRSIAEATDSSRATSELLIEMKEQAQRIDRWASYADRWPELEDKVDHGYDTLEQRVSALSDSLGRFQIKIDQLSENFDRFRGEVVSWMVARSPFAVPLFEVLP